MMRRFIVILIALALSCQVNGVELKLPRVISDGMVLQQSSEVNIWGWGPATQRVELSVSWSKSTFKAKASADGQWCAKVTTPKASNTPHSITVSCNGQSIKVSDVLIGEVWICSGQSNMQMPMRGFGSVEGGNFQPVLNSQAELDATNIPTLRQFKVGTRFGDRAEYDLISGSWQPATPTAGREFSAVALFFGRRLSQELNIPIGIINSSYGGSRIEAWMPAHLVEKVGVPYDSTYLKQYPRSRAGVIHNTMYIPIERYSIRGWCWYQGESNRANNQYYQALLEQMVAHWRESNGDKKNDKPFYLVEIAPFTSATGSTAAELRAAQFAAAASIPNAAIVSTADVGDAKFVHFPNKKPVGERLAALALARDYHREDIKPYSPHYKSVVFAEGEAIISVQNATKLIARGKISDFEVADADGKFYPVEARVEGNKIVLTLTSPAAPRAIRYAWKGLYDGNIANQDGLPLHPFSTTIKFD